MSINTVYRRLLPILAAVLFAIAISKWWTTQSLLIVHENMVDKICQEHVLSRSDQSFTAEEVTSLIFEIRKGLYNKVGPHQFRLPFIMLLFAEMVILLAMLHARGAKGRKA